MEEIDILKKMYKSRSSHPIGREIFLYFTHKLKANHLNLNWFVLQINSTQPELNHAFLEMTLNYGEKKTHKVKSVLATWDVVVVG